MDLFGFKSLFLSFCYLVRKEVRINIDKVLTNYYLDVP